MWEVDEGHERKTRRWRIQLRFHRGSLLEYQDAMKISDRNPLFSNYVDNAYNFFLRSKMVIQLSRKRFL